MRKGTFQRKIFLISIKSPLATILVISFTVAILLVMINTTYTNVYTHIYGEMKYENNDKEAVIVAFMTDTWNYGINSNQYVLWYINKEDRWYSAPVVEIIDDPEKNAVRLLIKPLKKDIENIEEELSQQSTGVYPVYVEVLTGKEKVIHKLLRTEVE